MSILTDLIIYTTLKEFSELVPEYVWIRYLDTTGSIGKMDIPGSEQIVGNPIWVMLFSLELQNEEEPWHTYVCMYENADKIRKYFSYLDGELA